MQEAHKAASLDPSQRERERESQAISRQEAAKRGKVSSHTGIHEGILCVGFSIFCQLRLERGLYVIASWS